MGSRGFPGRASDVYCVTVLGILSRFIGRFGGGGTGRVLNFWGLVGGFLHRLRGDFTSIRE